MAIILPQGCIENDLGRPANFSAYTNNSGYSPLYSSNNPNSKASSMDSSPRFLVILFVVSNDIPKTLPISFIAPFAQIYWKLPRAATLSSPYCSTILFIMLFRSCFPKSRSTSGIFNCSFVIVPFFNNSKAPTSKKRSK